jgi:hypothetical protein
MAMARDRKKHEFIFDESQHHDRVLFPGALIGEVQESLRVSIFVVLGGFLFDRFIRGL